MYEKNASTNIKEKKKLEIYNGSSTSDLFSLIISIVRRSF
jgi:hypothetical protein